MATAAGEEGKGMDETKSKESVDGLKDRKRLSDPILPHILKLSARYASSATAHDFEIYAPNATFEDPLMCAHGVKQIKSAFYSLSKVFGESKIVEYGIEETIAGPGRGEILIHNKQHYKLMGKDVDVVSLIKLRVEEGKVVRHEDCLSTDLERKTLRWDKKPLRNRETVKLPLLGRLAEIARRGSMLATHALMRFGKDPNP
ncbi:hypothetical protein ACLOJK_006004 [Asimina triloba]